MPKRVDDLAKAVELEKQQRKRLAAGDLDGDQLLQAVAIRQAGQWIVIREVGDALLGSPSDSAAFRLAKLALDRRNQSGELVLHDVVVSAGLHCRCRGVLPNAAGDEDERKVQFALAQHRQRGRDAETRHVVISHDNVPRLAVQGSGHRRSAVHPLAVQVESGSAEVPDQKGRVFLPVFDDENAERRIHRHRLQPIHSIGAKRDLHSDGMIRMPMSCGKSSDTRFINSKSSRASTRISGR